MKKTNKLIALAIAGTLAAPFAAQAANLETYGQVRMSLNIANNGDNGPGQESSANGISSNSSRIGFKGSEKLDNDMTAIYQAELDYSFDDAGTWAARDSFVGLKGDFGQVRAGNLSTPYKNATASIDPFGDTPGDYNTIIRHDTRAPNAIEYSSKDRDGLSFQAAMIMSTSNDELPQSTAQSDANGYSLAASYSKDKLMGSLAIENLGGTANDDKATKLGVLYSLDDKTKVGGVYEMIDDGLADNSTIYVSGTHKMDAKNTLKGAIGSRDSTSGASDGATFITFGATHQYSKNVEVYALYANVANDAGSSLGIKNAMASGITDKTASSLSIGINMSFSSM